MIGNGSSVASSAMNSLVLAFMGDAVIELFVREAVIAGGKRKIHALHKQAVDYVSARAQSVFLHELIEEGFLTDEEQAIIRRGRNTKAHSVPKNTDVQTYNYSTGFEALMGSLYFAGRHERIKAIMNKIFAKHPIEGSTGNG